MENLTPEEKKSMMIKLLVCVALLISVIIVGILL